MTLKEAKAHIDRLEKVGDVMRSILDDTGWLVDPFATSDQRQAAVREWEEVMRVRRSREEA